MGLNARSQPKEVLFMRKLIFMALLIALAAPVAAMADGTAPTAPSTANQTCKLALKTLGTTMLAQTYASNAAKANAFGKCVSSTLSSARAAVTNAATTCKKEQADQSFATSHGGKTFDQFYGGNSSQGKGTSANAFGKCVSKAVSNSVNDQVKAVVSAAKSCKVARKADPAGFATKYGPGHNAFAKCVAATKSTP
jgi:hypothetical protein